MGAWDSPGASRSVMWTAPANSMATLAAASTLGPVTLYTLTKLASNGSTSMTPAEDATSTTEDARNVNTTASPASASEDERTSSSASTIAEAETTVSVLSTTASMGSE